MNVGQIGTRCGHWKFGQGATNDFQSNLSAARKKSISVPRAIWISWAHDMFAWHSLKDVFVRTCSAMFPVTHFRETSWDLRACLTENSVEQAKEKKDEKEKDSKKQEKKVEKACATFVDTFHQYIYIFIYIYPHRIPLDIHWVFASTLLPGMQGCWQEAGRVGQDWFGSDSVPWCWADRLKNRMGWYLYQTKLFRGCQQWQVRHFIVIDIYIYIVRFSSRPKMCFHNEWLFVLPPFFCWRSSTLRALHKPRGAACTTGRGSQT